MTTISISMYDPPMSRNTITGLTGVTFGLLTVLGPGPTIHHNTTWRCRCRCGRERNAFSYLLRNGKVKSCGWCERKSPIRRTAPVVARILKRVFYDHGCWTSTAAQHFGYPRVNLGPSGRNAAENAHRVMYRELVGPIPPGYVIDHLCRNTACVNPDHLEAVPFQENMRRGASMNARMHAATHCKRGHEYTEHNTRWLDDGRRRSCKDCERARRIEKQQGEHHANHPS